jgi:hypothetical protein
LLSVERHRKHRCLDHTVLNHPSVVWRQFKTSEDGKQAFKDRGTVPAKPRGPKPTADLNLDHAKARIEELKEELEGPGDRGRCGAAPTDRGRRAGVPAGALQVGPRSD